MAAPNLAPDPDPERGLRFSRSDHIGQPARRLHSVGPVPASSEIHAGGEWGWPYPVSIPVTISLTTRLAETLAALWAGRLDKQAQNFYNGLVLRAVNMSGTILFASCGERIA